MNWPRWKLGEGEGGGREGARARSPPPPLPPLLLFFPFSLSLSLSLFLCSRRRPGKAPGGGGRGQGRRGGQGRGCSRRAKEGGRGVPPGGKEGGGGTPLSPPLPRPLQERRGGARSGGGVPGGPGVGAGSGCSLSPPPPPPPPPLRSRCSHLCTRRLGEGGGEGGAGGGVSGCAPLPPTIPCKCKKKKKRERERGRHRALAGPGGVGCSVCTESQLRRAQTRPGTQFSLFDFFKFLHYFTLASLFQGVFIWGKSSTPVPQVQRDSAPNRARLQYAPPPSFPGLQSAPVHARGAQGNTRVHRRVSACPWSVTVRAMAVSHPLTCESAHPDCAPGSEFPRTPTPGAGLADTPRSEDRGGLRGAGTREHVAWELACIRTQRKHVC